MFDFIKKFFNSTSSTERINTRRASDCCQNSSVVITSNVRSNGTRHVKWHCSICGKSASYSGLLRVGKIEYREYEREYEEEE